MNDTKEARLPASPINDLRSLLLKSKDQIKLALPRHLTADRMIRVAITSVQRTPALLECSPISIVGCVMQASELGLELAGPLGQCYMVPYNNKNTRQKEAQFQIGYRGLIDLAHRSGRVLSFSARVAYANDRFRYAYGTKPFIEHTPTMETPGEPIAVYAVLCLKGGATDFEVMSKAQIDQHRERYSRQKGGPWESAWDEMAKKTVIRRLAKRAPVSIELQTAAIVDEYAEAGVATSVASGIEGSIVDSPPPVGRVSMRKPEGNGHGEEPAPAAEPVAEEAPPAEPAPDQDAMGRQDKIDELREAIAEAQGPDEFNRLGLELHRHKEWLGEAHGELYAALVARSQAAAKSGKRKDF